VRARSCAFARVTVDRGGGGAGAGAGAGVRVIARAVD